MIDLSAEQRALLEGLARRRETSHSLVQRAQRVLRAATGEPNTQIATAVGLGEDAVGLWRRRWSQASAVLTAVAGQPKRLRAEVEQLLSDPPRRFARSSRGRVSSHRRR